MQIRLLVTADGSGEDEELTQALHDWLTEDRAVGHHAEISRSGGGPAPGSGAMSGDPSGWIQLLVGSGFSAAGLVYAHMAFRASLPRRRQDAAVLIERDGARITVTDASPETAARIVELLAPAVGDPGSEGNQGSEGDQVSEGEGGENGGAS
ncbi:hypothetical protein ACFYU9_24295 [Streptomyces sp. NPDC004327]|uniref:effector-associated constant component EACC1 n=1 Tax=unclassified Streptomyces TaxID=2593676 RepID=UPI0036990064